MTIITSVSLTAPKNDKSFGYCDRSPPSRNTNRTHIRRRKISSINGTECNRIGINDDNRTNLKRKYDDNYFEDKLCHHDEPEDCMLSKNMRKDHSYPYDKQPRPLNRIIFGLFHALLLLVVSSLMEPSLSPSSCKFLTAQAAPIDFVTDEKTLSASPEQNHQQDATHESQWSKTSSSLSNLVQKTNSIETEPNNENFASTNERTIQLVVSGIESLSECLREDSEGDDDIHIIHDDYTDDSEEDGHEADDYNSGANASDSKTRHEEADEEDDESDGLNVAVLIVATVDGTMAGLSKATGQMLWKRSPNQKLKQQHHEDQERTPKNFMASRPRSTHLMNANDENDELQPTSSKHAQHVLTYSLEPLVYTTTTVGTSRKEQWRTVAVPSILDGKVYLTASDVTVTTTAKELVTRSPFADRRGRIYTGATSTSAVALDGNTGEIIQVVGAGEHGISTDGDHRSFGYDTDAGPHHSSNDIEETNQAKKTKRNIVWLGRVDYAVTISEPKSGKVDVRFSTSELMSTSQMILRNSHESKHPYGTESIMNHRNELEITKDRIGQILQSETVQSDINQDTSSSIHHPEISSKESSFQGVEYEAETQAETSDPLSQQKYQKEHSKQQNHEHQPMQTVDSPSVVVTPNGHIAYLDSETGDILWVAEEHFNTPVAFCMDGSTGNSCHMETVPDAALPDDSPEYVSREIKRQLALLDENDSITRSTSSSKSLADQLSRNNIQGKAGTSSTSGRGHDNEEDDDEPSSIVSSLPETGQLFAMPLTNTRRLNSNNFYDTIKHKNRHKNPHKLLSSIAQSRTHHSSLTDYVIHNADSTKGLQRHASNLHQHHNQVSEYHEFERICNSLGKSDAPQDCGIWGMKCQTGECHHSSLSNHFTKGIFQDQIHQNSQSGLLLSSSTSPSTTTTTTTSILNYHNGHHIAFLSDPNFDKQDSSVDTALVPFYHHNFHENHFQWMAPLEQGHQRGNEEHFYDLLKHFKHHQEVQQQLFIADFYKQKRRKLLIFVFCSVITAFGIFIIMFVYQRRTRLKESDHTYGSRNNLEDLLTDNKTNLVFKQSESNKKECIIKVEENTVLGYGAHGTVVYKGELDGRPVAVKRMLTAFHASADREISLLIESDGHPNVVRYFLKEVRGEFIFLALELCDFSLHDLINMLHNLTALSKTATSSTAHEANNNVSIVSSNVNSSSSVSQATKDILFQIITGVRHLHRLRIVHRDLKPANILLARKNKSKARFQERLDSQEMMKLFEHGQYIAKISDMGLGKQFAGPSSYGVSLLNVSSACVQTNCQSSILGGKGTVGWQAPEVMAQRMKTDVSVKSDGSNGGLLEVSDSGSPDDPPTQTTRTSRSVDIFSLGCIFYTTLIPGSHPFGEWYEREANIMQNRPNLGILDMVSPEANDLISAMLRRNPKCRPTAKDVCNHPFFWSLERKLSFLCEFSDRLELLYPTDMNGSHLKMLLTVEHNATQIVGTSWKQKIDDVLLHNVQRFRSYDTSSVRDLLRLIRNKHHHFDELPDVLKVSMGFNSSGFMNYFEERFPKLLIHCCVVCREMLTPNDLLITNHSLDPIWNETSRAKINTAPSTISEKTSMSLDFLNQGNVVKDEMIVTDSCEEEDNFSRVGSLNSLDMTTETRETHVTSPPAKEIIESLSQTTDCVVSSSQETDNGMVVWCGSNTARLLNCRGWARSDDDWIRRIEISPRKKDPILLRSAEDLKFRTRLCNHWDLSYGTVCPLRKKNKCVFAHGPVELRVKEGKRYRWGKLVDEDGNCTNRKCSGGEDTYGAARAIEIERKEEGKWNNNCSSNQKTGQGNIRKKKQQTPAKKSLSGKMAMMS